MTRSAEQRLKVLVIAGVAHCGSTLLGALLGQLEGFFFVGELAHTARSLALGRACGCGEPLEACPVWRDVFTRAFSAPGSGGPDALGMSPSEERSRGVVLQLLRERRLLARSPELERTRDAFVATLRAVQEATGCRVVVDSSKSPAYVRLLRSDPRLDVKVVHLVRDPRATAWSWQKSHEHRQRDPIPITAALTWDVWNPLIELLWARQRDGYLRLPYEDLAASPRSALERIATLVGEYPAAFPLVSADEAQLEPTHSVAGNANRLRTGLVRIARDDEWLRAERFQRLGLVNALTWPLRLRYGYRGQPR